MQDEQGSESQRPEGAGFERDSVERTDGQADHADAGPVQPASAPSPDPQASDPEAAGPPASSGPAFSPPDSGQPGYAPPPAYGQPGSAPPAYGQPEHGPGGFGPGGYGPGRPGPVGYGPGSPGPAGYGPGGYGPSYGQGGYGQGGYGPQPGTRARRRRTLLTYLTVAVVAAAVGAGLTGYALRDSPSASSSSGTPSGRSGNAGNGSGLPGTSVPGAGTGNTGVSAATKRAVVSAVKPGLVNISSNLGYQGSQAAATGMVISSDGLVLTNNHVITDTTQLYAKVLATGKRYPAKWLGYDATDDVAVIRLVGAHNLRTVPLGNSSGVKLGDRVIAIGNAYGAGTFPAVAGAITGLNRTITASDSGAATKETLHGMFQTNAGIVQGDSGGPLSTTTGKVIGMDTAAATGSFGSATQSVGFAIPINKALGIADQIIAGKSSPQIQIGSTGFMGVLVPAGAASQLSSPQQQRTHQLKEDRGASGLPVQPSVPACLQNQQGAGVPSKVAPVSSGALIIGELCGTPADRHGIIAGDVITSVGGHAISTPKQLTSVMLGFRPGNTVKVTWVDVSGQTHKAALDLVQAPPR
ncbi:MAG: trypsin-like peptidase domain-containing protein [Streptosporangiaceae bacterium]